MEIHLEHSFLCPRYLFIFVFALFSLLFFSSMHFVADIITLYAIWTVVEIEFVSRVFLAVSVLLYEIFLAIFFSPRLDKVKGVKNLSAAVTLIVPV